MCKKVPSLFETNKIVFQIFSFYSTAKYYTRFILWPMVLEHKYYHVLIHFFFRIWSHGLQSHQRKSALWHYLYKFGRTNEKLLRFKGTLGVQAYCIPLINSKPYILPDHSRPIQVVIDPKVRKNSFVRAHLMFSRIFYL